MSIKNTRHELPSNIPVFDWSERLRFAELVLSLGGSSDAHGADLCETDRPGHHGRYPRNYTVNNATLQADVEGQTMSFLASSMRRSIEAPNRVVALIGCPWATFSERNATYRMLADCGVNCNDAHDDEYEIAKRKRLSVVPS